MVNPNDKVKWIESGVPQGSVLSPPLLMTCLYFSPLPGFIFCYIGQRVLLDHK